MMRRMTMFLLALTLLSGAIVSQAQDSDDTPPAEDGIAVTVYNQGTALVQDRRTFTLESGIGTLNFTDVASQIDPTSVSIASLTDPMGTVVLEQNYVYDLVGTSALLERYVDQTIAVTVEDGTTFTGTLLSGRSGDIILQTENGGVEVVSLSKARNVSFPELPDGLITRPTLRWMLRSDQGGDQQLELRYLTSGMNWSADYIVLLNDGNTSIDINGWITLNNTSGTAYPEATLKLIAGDVNRLPEQEVFMAMDAAAPRAAIAEEAVQQRDIFEYKLYEIPRPVTIGNNETKQVEFVSGSSVTANTYYVYNGMPYFYGYGGFITDQYYGESGITDVQNYLEFTTGEESGLDADLPAGRIRVYQEDIDGAALLIGENSIDHTPKGEDVQIFLGNAFDLVGERTQTDFNIIARNVVEETYEIRLRNRKETETVEIRVPERLFRWSNWEILNSSDPYEQLNSSTIEFRVNVEPGEEKVITYTVRYSRPD